MIIETETSSFGVFLFFLRWKACLIVSLFGHTRITMNGVNLEKKLDSLEDS